MNDQTKKKESEVSGIEVTPREADQMGAFIEDALTPEEALESGEDNGPEVF